MAKITAYNIVKAIGNLPRNRDFNYVNDRTPGKIRIVDITEDGIQIREEVIKQRRMRVFLQK